MLQAASAPLRLATIDQKTFISLISKADSGISQADVQSMWSTLSALRGRSSGSSLDFLLAAQCLIRAGSTPPTKDATQYLSSLATAAHQAATSLLCSSILAGQGSESDDFGDCALFVGQVDATIALEGATKEAAEKILRAAGLEAWLTEGSEIEIVAGGTPPLPASLDKIPAHRREASRDALARLQRLLGTLRGTFEFRIITSGHGGLVLHFLVGRGDGGWQGLVGASTWSGEE